jgi:tripartite-type tricarboxylate transporter receptor subunit TctC
MRSRTLVLAVSTALAALVSGAMPAAAQTAADFYRGRQMRFLTGYGPGTGYDLYMRIVQRHIGQHIPGNPNVLPENMPGAGGLVMTNYLYNIAARDGSTIGLPSRNLLTDPLYGNDLAKFDALKFNWIGSISSDVATCLGWRAAGATSAQVAQTREIKIGGNGPLTDSAIMPRVMNALIGTKFKIFNGYTDSGAVGLAMEQGEVEGYCGFTLASVRSSKPQWLTKNQVAIMFQMGPEKHRDLPDVPNVLDMAKDETSRQALMLVFGAGKMGRPVAAPPGVPADRVAVLRKAFDETMQDPQFLTEAKKLNIDIDGPSDGAAVEALLKQLYATQKEVVDRVTELRNRQD